MSEWRDILCCYYRLPTYTITDIQQALIQRGYLEKENGAMDRKTKKAVKRFQHDKGLPKNKGLLNGMVNEATLKSLGIPPEAFFQIEKKKRL